jgi:CubicO group peptidase (beta-lactamase class C family)
MREDDMKKTIKLFIVFITLGILISLLFQSVKIYAADNESNGINKLKKDSNEKIQKFIENNMDKGKIPGLSVVIVKDNETVYQKGFGYTDLEHKIPVTSKSIFELGSNSKAFTALGILNLQKDGRIKLEDRVTKYIPWLKVNYEGKDASITIEQLLHHTSGIPYNTIDKIPSSNEDNTLEKTVRTLVGINLASRPGEKYQYATINYDVLGLIIQKVAGRSYEKYIEDSVLKPMNLNNTYLDRGQATDNSMTKGYKLAFLKPSLYDAPIYRGNKPAGYILSNAEDMGKWLKIQLGTSSDSNFSKNLIKISQQPSRKTPPLADGSFYADGWFVYQSGSEEISHRGNNPNYSSFIVFRPEEKIGVAILANINSEYVAKIGQGINKLLQGKVDTTNVTDLNKTTDNVSVLVSVIAGLIIIITLYFTIKALIQIFKKERKLVISKKSILAFTISLTFIAGLSYALYLIPYILFNGVSWRFVFVWLPKSIKVALYLVYSAIWFVSIYSILVRSFSLSSTALDTQKNEKKA